MTTVAFFNNKGGVGKTSLVYHLAWMLDELGQHVIAADLDPQANLTGMFLDEASTVHTCSSVSISAHSAPRTSPDLAAVSTSNSNASLTTGAAPRRPHLLDRRRHVAMRQRPHVLDEILLRPEHRPDAAARVVVAVVQRHGPLHDRADALPDPPRRRRPLVPDLAERSGACSSAATSAPFTGCRLSICTATSPSSRGGTIGAGWTPSTRWR